MRTLIFRFLLIISFINLISCGDSKETNQSATNSEKTASETNECLLAYQSKYDELLSVEEILATANMTKDNLKVEYKKSSRHLDMHEYKLLFKNQRKGYVKVLNSVAVVPDVIKISGIKAMKLGLFEQTHRAATEEEKKYAQQAMEDVIDGKVQNKEAEKAVQTAEKHNVSKEQLKKTGSAVTNVINEVNDSYVEIPDLGGKAVWNTYVNELSVWDKGVAFSVHVEISNDEAHNKAVATQIAQKILNKCK